MDWQTNILPLLIRNSCLILGLFAIGQFVLLTSVKSILKTFTNVHEAINSSQMNYITIQTLKRGFLPKKY